MPEKSVKIEIAHHFSAIGPTPVVKVLEDTFGKEIQNGFMYGLPIGVFNVPTETGRRYRLTIEECEDSAPSPELNPWKTGQWA